MPQPSAEEANPAASAGVAWRRGAGVTLLFTGLGVYFTWPLLPQLTTHLPAHVDPPFSAWRVAWVARQIVHDPAHLFDANIFAPEPNTLAYSDAMLLQGILGLPLLAIGVSPIALTNLFGLAGFVSSACAAYVLARRLTGHTGAGIVAGIIFAFAPYRMAHLPHLELQWAQWIPLAFWAWHRVMASNRARDGALCALFVLLQLFSSIYYGIFLALTLVIVSGATIVAARRLPGPRAIAGLAVGLAITAAAATWYARPYEQVKAQLGERDPGETAHYSARPIHFFTPVSGSYLYGGDPRQRSDEFTLFPGATTLVLAGAALVPPLSPVAGPYAAGLVFTGIGAAGMNTPIYRWLREWVPPLRGLRVPARFAAVMLLMLGTLAASGVAKAAARWNRRPVLVTALPIVLLVVEFSARPMESYALSASPPPVYRWLAQQPPTTILEMPAPTPSTLPLYDSIYMYWSTWHWHTLINGYSGHYAPRYPHLLGVLPRLDRDTVRALGTTDVKYILLHRELFAPGKYERVTAAFELNPAFRFVTSSLDDYGEVRVYEFVGRRRR